MLTWKILGEMTWEEARDKVSGLGDQWRMPSLNEFAYFVSIRTDNDGDDIQNGTYWSRHLVRNKNAFAFDMTHIQIQLAQIPSTLKAVAVSGEMERE